MLFGILGFIFSETTIDIMLVLAIKYSVMTITFMILVITYPRRMTVFNSSGTIILLICASIVNLLQLSGYAIGSMYAGMSGSVAGLLSTFEYTSQQFRPAKV